MTSFGRIEEFSLLLKETGTHIQRNLNTTLKPALFKIRGAYDKFPDFIGMSTFIESTHMKL